MKRGEIWTASGGNDYAGKPRPVVIVQDDQFDATSSITICAFTTDPAEAPLYHLPVTASDQHGLNEACRLMIDKIRTISKSELGYRIGRIGDDDVLRLNRAILVILGLAVSPKGRTTE